MGIALVCVALLAPPSDSEEATRSLSVGSPGSGALVNGQKLPLEGRGYRVVAQTRARSFVFGTEELIGVIQRAARRVRKDHPGSVLHVGNLSRKRGGNIPQSVTHNSGRDVDLLFYALDEAGEKTTPAFARFDRNGEARVGERTLSFDATRNWALVHALLRDRKAQVQSILVARWLKPMLLEQAKKTGARTWIVKRAKEVLRQPSRSGAHDDHFHVRVACAHHERLRGCINAGYVPDWVKTFDEDILALAAVLAGEVTHEDTKHAVEASRRLGELRAKTASGQLAAALADKRLEVRSAALRALEEIRALDEALPDVLKAAQVAKPGAWRARLLRVLARKGPPEALALFCKVLPDTEKALPASREACARGLGALKDPTAVPLLFAAVADAAEPVRDAAAKALHRITNHDLGKGEEALTAWKAWWEKHSGAGRVAWLLAGFDRVADPASHCRKAVRQLVRKIRRGGVASANARDLITALTGYTPRRPPRSRKRLHRKYLRWLRRGGARGCRLPD